MLRHELDPVKNFSVGGLKVNIYTSRQVMGKAAAAAVGNKIRELLSKRQSINMVFAAAPSQNEFLEALCQEPSIDWSRIIAFHLDDYIGLPENAPQKFTNYLKEHIFSKLNFGKVFLMNGNELSPEEECRRYSKLLEKYPLDIACIGIGENGHLAFNDPPLADFTDSKLVKVVQLEESCRLQQVHDGCFNLLPEVPTHALTLTIPAILLAKWVYCIVPGFTKSEAVKRVIEGKISKECPATVLKNHNQSFLFLDPDSASKLKN